MHRLCLVVLCLPAVSIAQDKKPASRPEAPGFTRFAWPVPCDVRVVEKSVTGTRAVTIAYTLRLRKDNEHEGRIRVSRTGVAVVAPDGKTAPPSLDAAMFAAYVPDLHIDASGTRIAVVGTDRTIDKIVEAYEKETPKDPDTLPAAEFRRIISSRLLRGKLEENAKQAWSAWVGAWVGMQKLESGKQLETTSEFLMPADKPFRGEATIRHRGRAKDSPGHIELALEARFEGDAYLEWCNKKYLLLCPPYDPETIPVTSYDSATLVRRMSAVIEPATLRPARATTETISTLDPRGGRQQRVVERHEYEFRWKPAEKPDRRQDREHPRKR